MSDMSDFGCHIQDFFLSLFHTLSSSWDEICQLTLKSNLSQRTMVILSLEIEITEFKSCKLKYEYSPNFSDLFSRSSPHFGLFPWKWSVSHSVMSNSLWPQSPLDSSVCGILQARILKWVAIPFSRGSSQPRDWTQVSRIAGRFFTSGSTLLYMLIWNHPFQSCTR